MTPIFAFDTTRRLNADAVADAATFGYLDGEVLDLTVGPKGRFWLRYRPEFLVTNDLDPTVAADLHLDATKSGLPDDWCDTAVWDPPYGYRGTSRLASDADYGLTVYRPANTIDALLFDGTVEACRIARRYVLVKCQSSCVSSEFRDQVVIVARAAEVAGARVAGQLHVYGVRPQPKDKRQLNVWANYSTLVILDVGPRRRRKR